MTKNATSPTRSRDRHITANYLADLNSEQRCAVEHGITGSQSSSKSPLLVIAGAGSGKTKTLSHRVAHLVVNGINPSRILLLTFSRRAAEEMRSRVEQITRAALGSTRVDLPWSGTFHAIGARLLREFATDIGLNPSFTILDRSDAADQMNLIRHDLGLSKTRDRFPSKEACLSIYSRAVNSDKSLKVVIAQCFPWCKEWKSDLRELCRKYVAIKKRQNTLDYDDLLLYWAEMMNDKRIAAEIRDRFDHVLVDEYQDTNCLQARILLGLKPKGAGLMVVGDDAQSIYSFRAATVRNILDFPKQFKQQARIVTLEQNYRSTQPILKACNKVIHFASERYTKNLYSERPSKQKPFITTVEDEGAQARYAAKRILEAREEGLALKDQAILFRASHHSAQLEIELAQRKIPFRKFGGQKFLEAAHVKDVVAFFRWVENPMDRVAGFRVVKLLPGVGPVAASAILQKAEAAKNPVAALSAHKVPKATAEDWPKFVKLLGKLRGDSRGWPGEFDLLRQWYEPHLHRKYDDAQLRIADLSQLEQIASSYRCRQQFLTELTLDPPNATSGAPGASLPDDDDYVVLSTIHSAKGKEWCNVKILSVVDGCLPSSKATSTPEEIEEERRLLYVAMTRAKDELELIVPLRFFDRSQAHSGDGHMYASISRFIPESIRKYFDCRGWRERRVDGVTERRNSSPVDLSAKLMRKWR